MKNEERDWLDVLDSYDDTASDSLRAVIEPLPSWDQAGCSGNATFHTSTLPKRTGRSLRVVEPAREGTHTSRDPDPLENDIPLERTRRANGDPRRKCVYYEEEERFWKERSESCRIQQNAAASSVYDVQASDNDAGDRTRPRVKTHPGAPQGTVSVSPHMVQSCAFLVQNSGENPGSVEPTALRRTPVSRGDTPEMKEPRRSVDSNSEAEALREAEERRTIGRGGESRDVKFHGPERRPLSAGQVSDGVRCRQRSEERLCLSNCRCRCRGSQKENVRRLYALRDVERVLDATLVASKGGGGSGNGGKMSDFYVNADRMPNKEAKRFDKEMAAVIATDDAKVFSSSVPPRRRPRCRGRKGGVFFGDKEKGRDRAGSIEGPGGYRKRRTAASASASPAGRDRSFFEEECEMNRGDDEEEGEACDYDNQEEEAALGRVGDLGRSIALRCLHMEQECMRRERTQARLFEEQLRGARLAAQETTQRAIRVERSRAEKLLAEAQNKYDGREKAFVEQSKHEQEKWKKERDVLSADAAAAKTELDKTKRLSRDITESLKRDGEKSLEKQRMELQRSWVAEKGGWRKATEEAVRRAVEAKTRAGEEAARQAQELRNSFEAQIRSWKGKAEASEKRASEEKGKRQALETKANNERSKEMANAREAQEAILQDMTSTIENERKAHAREKEKLQDEHRAHLLRVHQEKRGILEAERVKWQQEREEIRAQANARVEEALAHATQEHTEAFRCQRLAHDAEMRKAGEDILRLEREIRRLKAKNEGEGSSSLKAPSAGVHSRMRSALRWPSPENLGCVSHNAGRPGRGRDVDDSSGRVRLLEADV